MCGAREGEHCGKSPCTCVAWASSYVVKSPCAAHTATAQQEQARMTPRLCSVCGALRLYQRCEHRLFGACFDVALRKTLGGLDV